MIAAEAQYRAWMVAALAGDANAYRQLLGSLTRHLRGYFRARIGADMAEDLVQETLMAIHTRRGTYDTSQPFTAWVFGIARHKLVDEFRKAKRRPSVPLDEAPELFAADDTGAAIAKRDVQKLLAQLPEGKRSLLTSVKLDGEAVADVAREADMSESAVKVSVHRSLKSLSDGVRDADG